MILFVTQNPEKVLALKRHVSLPVTAISAQVEEIQSLDPIKVITHKAIEAFKILKEPLVVEDTALTFHALNKLPGPLIKWFLEELEPRGLCRLLDAYSDRSATAAVYFAFYDGVRLEIFSQKITGTVPKSPLGKAGWGWDSVFIPQGEKHTWGQRPEVKSLREKAAKQLEKFLHGYIAPGSNTPLD